MKLQLTIEQLSNMLEAAKEKKQRDARFSDTISIEINVPCSSHLGGDNINAFIKDKYSQFNSEKIY